MHFKRGKSSAGMGGRTVLLPLSLPSPGANVAESCWFVTQKSTSKEGLGHSSTV